MAEAPKRLYLSQTDKKLGGVCGGLAEYLGLDPTLVRILWIVLAIVSVGVGVLAYLVFWVAAPKGPEQAYAPPPPPPVTRSN